MELVETQHEAGDVRPDVVRQLEIALTEAKQGTITAVAIVKLAHPERISIQSAGRMNGAIVAGLHYLQTQLVEAMFAPRPGGIVVPRR